MRRIDRAGAQFSFQRLHVEWSRHGRRLWVLYLDRGGSTAVRSVLGGCRCFPRGMFLCVTYTHSYLETRDIIWFRRNDNEICGMTRIFFRFSHCDGLHLIKQHLQQGYHHTAWNLSSLGRRKITRWPKRHRQAHRQHQNSHPSSSTLLFLLTAFSSFGALPSFALRYAKISFEL